MESLSGPGRYEVQEVPHGEGGFGRVLKGRDPVLERDVAIKQLNALVSKFDEAQQERFRREARILASLSHPNIPAIYDVLADSNSFQIVFQFVAGKTLKELIESSGPISLGQAQLWFRQLASALDHAHARGVVHRDIKPQNIIITEDGESAYLVDFGIALSKEEATRLTDSGMWIGTPGYAPPEQMSGDAIDQRADLYPLGVSLYEALAGERLGQGEYKELANLNQAIPPAIDDLIQDCLAERDKRVSSARAFSQRLSQAFVPSRPLAEVLAKGRLHEIALALEGLTPDAFSLLPAGQRALLFVKIDDMTAPGDSSLQYAARDFLQLLVTRGLRLPAKDYRRIGEPAVFWAYEHLYGSQLGDRSLRDALRDAATLAGAEQLAVLVTAVLELLDKIPAEDRPDWYLHALRELLYALMANPSLAESSAQPLADALQKVNRTQRSRAS